MAGKSSLKILIVEDEARIARRVERLTREILSGQIERLVVKDKLLPALDYVRQHPIDLLLLDLNLSGDDGFDLLKTVVAESFSTVIISAYRDKAIEAFEYGVLDFVAKPFKKERLEKAFRRVQDRTTRGETPAKHLAVKKHGRVQLLDVGDILYIQGANIYSEIHLKSGRKELSDKSLESLFQLLPSSFVRIHKSYIANLAEAEEIIVQPGGKYELRLKNEMYLPIGRTRYRGVREVLKC